VKRSLCCILKSVALLLLLLAFRAVIKRRERCDDSGNAVKRSNLWACAAPAAAAMHHEGMFLSLHHHFCMAAAAVRFTQDLLKFMSIQDRLAVAGYCLVAITIKVLRLSLSLMLYDMHTSNCGCFVLLHYSIIFRRGSYNGRPLTALTARAYRVNGTGKYFLTLGGMCLFLIPLYECHT
jgi:hypothetical protein